MVLPDRRTKAWTETKAPPAAYASRRAELTSSQPSDLTGKKRKLEAERNLDRGSWDIAPVSAKAARKAHKDVHTHAAERTAVASRFLDPVDNPQQVEDELDSTELVELLQRDALLTPAQRHALQRIATDPSALSAAPPPHFRPASAAAVKPAFAGSASAAVPSSNNAPANESIPCLRVRYCRLTQRIESATANAAWHDLFAVTAADLADAVAANALPRFVAPHDLARYVDACSRTYAEHRDYQMVTAMFTSRAGGPAFPAQEASVLEYHPTTGAIASVTSYYTHPSAFPPCAPHAAHMVGAAAAVAPTSSAPGSSTTQLAQLSAGMKSLTPVGRNELGGITLPFARRTSNLAPQAAATSTAVTDGNGSSSSSELLASAQRLQPDALAAALTGGSILSIPTDLPLSYPSAATASAGSVAQSKLMPASPAWGWLGGGLSSQVSDQLFSLGLAEHAPTKQQRGTAPAAPSTFAFDSSDFDLDFGISNDADGASGAIGNGSARADSPLWLGLV